LLSYKLAGKRSFGDWSAGDRCFPAWPRWALRLGLTSLFLGPATIGLYVWENILGFLKKAGTTILVATLIVWALSYFPRGDVMTSYLGMAGKVMEPVGSWMGLPWPVLVALLTSFVAKENTVATLAVLYGSLDALKTVITPAAMLAFLVFQILFVPCIGTVAAIQQETKSWKWTLTSVGMQLALSLGLAVTVYQVGKLF
jgi:ferrous iron transport protein B